MAILETFLIINLVAYEVLQSHRLTRYGVVW